MNLKDKIVWISGASSGIGAYLAQAFHKNGAKVILSARREDRLTSLSQKLGDGAAVLPMDVTQYGTLESLHEAARDFFGPIDILVNNAGITQRGKVEETLLSVDQRIMDVNFFGNIALTKAVLPSMIERRQGHIVVISSLVGKLSTPYRSSYSASKHALHGYYDALRAEVADRNIQVHVICPGYIKTEISIHALNPQGQQHGVMDKSQIQGMEPDICAQEILKAIKRGKKEAYIGGKETKYVYLRRFLPGLYHNIIAKMAREKKF